MLDAGCWMDVFVTWILYAVLVWPGSINPWLGNTAEREVIGGRGSCGLWIVDCRWWIVCLWIVVLWIVVLWIVYCSIVDCIYWTYSSLVHFIHCVYCAYDAVRHSAGPLNSLEGPRLH
jgi:hypothetical protein